jgi:hypothetical protein
MPKTNLLPLMTLIQLIDADTPKTFATQCGTAATKTKPLQHGGTEEAEENQTL